ncbi:hypothetical protein Lalb_Chr04g0252181 [Lupinus albus]|uniref:Uncharacterized protein n=1 Tax=Lupinus albus TaxID=3870 RepID=A0A6A4QNL4_LUPAL|nr:hypothetical protein Lalb_Chr04g0252181 [Lupinus albus]
MAHIVTPNFTRCIHFFIHYQYYNLYKSIPHIQFIYIIFRKVKIIKQVIND